MRAESVDAATGLLVAIVVLLLVIAGQQAYHRVRRRRDAVLRPALERALAAHLADEDEPAPAPATRQERLVLRQVALAALLELRGVERQRVTALLEATGVVADTVRELGSRRRLRRRRAADMLADIRSASARPALVERLEDRDRAVRLASARALAELGEVEDLPRALAVAERDVDASPGAVSDVLLAVAATQPGLLAETLSRPGPDALRRLVVAILGELRLAEYAPQLRDALGSPDEEVVARSARGLGLIGDDQAVEALGLVVADASRADATRAAAATSLGWIGDPRGVGPLATALLSGRWTLESSAAQALALLGAPGADALRRVVSSSRGEPRVHALVALHERP